MRATGCRSSPLVAVPSTACPMPALPSAGGVMLPCASLLATVVARHNCHCAVPAPQSTRHLRGLARVSTAVARERILAHASWLSAADAVAGARRCADQRDAGVRAAIAESPLYRSAATAIRSNSDAASRRREAAHQAADSHWKSCLHSPMPSHRHARQGQRGWKAEMARQLPAPQGRSRT